MAISGLSISPESSGKAIMGKQEVGRCCEDWMKHSALSDLTRTVGLGDGERMQHMHNSVISINLLTISVFILQGDSGKVLYHLRAGASSHEKVMPGSPT